MFYIFVLVLITVSAQCITCSPIVNGEDASENEFPYAVSIRGKYNDHICTGTLIGPSHVVTAAHCFGSYVQILTSIIVAGTNSKTEKGLIHSIESVFNYNDWPRKKPGEHDLLILQLKKPTVLKPEKLKKGQIAVLPIKPLKFHTKAVVAGWGMMKKPVEPDNLQKLITYVQTFDYCRSSVDPIMNYAAPYEICTFVTKHQGVCDGDSGGPLMQADTLIGVVLHADEDCGKTGIDVYANVYEYLDFIYEVLNQEHVENSNYKLKSAK